MKYTAKKIESGYYHYRGYWIESQGTASYPSWGFNKIGEEYPDEYQNSLTLAKAYIDRQIIRESNNG